MAKKKNSETGYIVTQRFMDADEYAVNGQKQTYEVDADVSHLDADRLKDLVKKGLVKEGTVSQESGSQEADNQEDAE